MSGSLYQTFRSIKCRHAELPNNTSSPASWSVYLIISANKPIKTYVGVTTNFSRRLKQHNRELKGGAKASHAGRPWLCACIIQGFKDHSEDKHKGLEREIVRAMEGERFVKVYLECSRSHFAALGLNILDGCHKYIGKLGEMHCEACGSHQSFHSVVLMPMRDYMAMYLWTEECNEIPSQDVDGEMMPAQMQNQDSSTVGIQQDSIGAPLQAPDHVVPYAS